MSQEQLKRFGPRVTGAVQEIEGLVRTPARVLGDLRSRPRPARRFQLSVSAQGRQAPSGTP